MNPMNLIQDSVLVSLVIPGKTKGRTAAPLKKLATSDRGDRFRLIQDTLQV